MAKKIELPIKRLKDQRISTLYGEPLVFHCNHFNLYLQRTIEDASTMIESEKILIDGAVISAYSMFKNLLTKNPKLKSAKERLEVCSAIYSHLGFGLLPLADVNEETTIVTTSVTHYSFAWKAKWGTREKPVDYFTCGYLQAVMAAVFDKAPESYEVKQISCLTMGDEVNKFEIKRVAGRKPYPDSVGVGAISTLPYKQDSNGNVDSQTITETVATLPLKGDGDGLIAAFGVYLTRHFGNYYNYITFETVKGITEATKEEGFARDLFIEAGHVCGFNTFGGIMKSPEWDGLVLPQLKNKEDWVYGITAVLNALGWGMWSVESVNEGTLKMRIDSDYECNGYLAMYGKATDGVKSYVATGVAAAFMNLIYLGDIQNKPELDEEFYSKLFHLKQSYLGNQIQCRSTGSSHAEITVSLKDFSG